METQADLSLLWSKCRKPHFHMKVQYKNPCLELKSSNIAGKYNTSPMIFEIALDEEEEEEEERNVVYGTDSTGKLSREVSKQ